MMHKSVPTTLNLFLHYFVREWPLPRPFQGRTLADLVALTRSFLFFALIMDWWFHHSPSLSLTMKFHTIALGSLSSLLHHYILFLFFNWIFKLALAWSLKWKKKCLFCWSPLYLRNLRLKLGYQSKLECLHWFKRL